jgi:hypothetical protein
MQILPCTPTSSAHELRNRPGFTALAVLMLSLGVGATTALFSLVDDAMPRSAATVECETVMRIAGNAPSFAIANVPSRAELRDRVSDAYQASVESAGDALDALPDTSDVLGEPAALALLGAVAIGFLLLCTRSASRMVTSARAPQVAIGTTAGALAVATLSLRALELPAIGVRAVAFALCISLLTVWFARAAQRRGSPLTI